MEGESCHSNQPAGRPKTLRSFLSGIGAALIACICCIIPAAAVAFGLSLGANWEKYDTLSYAVSIGWLLIWSCLTYRKHRHEPAVARKQIAVTIVSFGLMFLLVRKVLIPLLTHQHH